MTVRTRIAPSPTGEDIHVGNVATALMNFAWAKKNNGKFIVRIEDTDRKRFVEGCEERILDTLSRLGIEPDESPRVGGKYGPYRQSERLEIYNKYAQILIEKGFAYYCTCSEDRLKKLRLEQTENKKPPKYDKLCLKKAISKKQIKSTTQYVIRLNVPENTKITFTDTLRGEITIDSNTIDDQVLMKSDGYPTYHLAVVVDDALMEISHVIRAEEWLSSTPKHVLLYKAFGWKLPSFTHIPLLRNPDKSKLSKRKNPVWASKYLDDGILPEAFLNYIALLGWSHPSGKEIFSLEEYIRVFDIKDIQTTAPIFDPVKLEWMSGKYIRKKEKSELKYLLYRYFHGRYDENILEKTIPLIHERIKTLKEYDKYCRFFIERPTEYEMNLKEHNYLIKTVYSVLEKIEEENWKTDKITYTLQKIAGELGLSNSKFFLVLRVAITGSTVTPPLSESMEILGRKECLERLKKILMKC